MLKNLSINREKKIDLIDPTKHKIQNLTIKPFPLVIGNPEAGTRYVPHLKIDRTAGIISYGLSLHAQQLVNMNIFLINIILSIDGYPAPYHFILL